MMQDAVPDYALRTFTTRDVPEPRAPPGIVPCCCQRVAAVARAEGVDFVNLPHRDRQWAPVRARHGAGIARPLCRIGGIGDAGIAP